MLTITVIFGYILFFQYEVIRTSYSNEIFDIDKIKGMTTAVFAIISMTFLAVIVWAYDVSSRLVGAFERILRELDEIIAGKGKHHIKARKDDLLANTLLERVNKLIDKLP